MPVRRRSTASLMPLSVNSEISLKRFKLKPKPLNTGPNSGWSLMQSRARQTPEATGIIRKGYWFFFENLLFPGAWQISMHVWKLQVCTVCLCNNNVWVMTKISYTMFLRWPVWGQLHMCNMAWQIYCYMYFPSWQILYTPLLLLYGSQRLSEWMYPPWTLKMLGIRL